MVIIDELSQIGTAQLLKLLRLREKHGFIILATGDDKQCRSVEAGAVVDLLRQALGEEAIPQILTTVRQQTEREREIAGLFREGKTVQEATGIPVALAFDSGNLLPVAQALRELYPTSPIKIFGDDDRFLPLRSPALPNVGRDKAIEAAEAVGGEAMFPTFPAGDPLSADWNDLAHVAGIEAVRRALAPRPRSLRAMFAAPNP